MEEIRQEIESLKNGDKKDYLQTTTRLLRTVEGKNIVKILHVGLFTEERRALEDSYKQNTDSVNTILSAAEKLRSLVNDNSEAIALIDSIITACNFHDLSGQYKNKISKGLNKKEFALIAFMKAMGEEDFSMIDEIKSSPDEDKLMKGPQGRKASSQDEIDEILDSM
jgi:chemotaxis regulatin CheY-phosphate phosphatase CheZ